VQLGRGGGVGMGVHHPPCAASADLDEQPLSLVPAAALQPLSTALAQLSSAQEAAALLAGPQATDEGEPPDSESGGESDSGAEGGWDANYCAFYKSCGRGNGCSATDQKQRMTRSQTVRKLHEKQECEAEAVQPLGTPQKLLSRVVRWPSRTERKSQDLTNCPVWGE